jgi:protein translocase SecG subunit
MLKFIWLIVSVVLIVLILTRTPKNSGLESFATKSNLLGSPNSAEKILNQFTWFLIASYFILGVSFNFSN